MIKRHYDTGDVKVQETSTLTSQTIAAEGTGIEAVGMGAAGDLHENYFKIKLYNKFKVYKK